MGIIYKKSFVLARIHYRSAQLPLKSRPASDTVFLMTAHLPWAAIHRPPIVTVRSITVYRYRPFVCNGRLFNGR